MHAGRWARTEHSQALIVQRERAPGGEAFVEKCLEAFLAEPDQQDYRQPSLRSGRGVLGGLRGGAGALIIGGGHLFVGKSGK